MNTDKELKQEHINTNDKKGMPKGIPFIIGNEAAERFSYYGMKAILTIFMVKYLQMNDSTATEWYHNFGTAVYFLPIFGALLSPPALADDTLQAYPKEIHAAIETLIGDLPDCKPGTLYHQTKNKVAISFECLRDDLQPPTTQNMYFFFIGFYHSQF